MRLGPPVGVAVLAVSVDPVRDPVVHRDVIHLGDRGHHPAPALAAVLGDAAAPVVSDQDALRHPGVDPDVVVVAAGAVGGLDEGAAAVHGGAEENRGEIDAVGVLGIHRDPYVVGRPFGEIVVGHHEPPGIAAVVRAIEARAHVLDQGVPAVGIAGGDGDRHLADGMPLPAGEPPAAAIAGLLTRNPFPGVASVTRAVEPAARPAAPQAAGVDPELPHPGEEKLGMAEVHGEVGASGVLVHVEDELPVGASVPRPIDTALRLRRVGMAEGAGVDEVRILRVDQDPGDAPGGLEAPVVERPPAVGGTVDAVPHRERRPDDEGLAGPGPHLARMGR